ncbi:hypothetical protein [Frondihabitans sp. VKM Ac-2883]|uniref:hypothetical protein n=1 Tax=Frondihabitans sp. VKM Ac-2883 TaxID=2783823 RepID=UPI00188C311F|nr:hypothetical protein [Frondihabitans sp. VKM Ac-2883]MBF4575279.1 hypothetical protein [Frondihabitans sp. VKM Ac-2883]
MPTTLHRFTITETPAIAQAIDIAATTWPEIQNDRAALLRRIVEFGSDELQKHRVDEIEKRRALIRAGAGSATGAFPPNALEQLRADWPA